MTTAAEIEGFAALVIHGAAVSERARCIKVIERLRDEHCTATYGACTHDDELCDFVAAWSDAIRALQALE
jgi:hypothetical protein